MEEIEKLLKNLLHQSQEPSLQRDHLEHALAHVQEAQIEDCETPRQIHDEVAKALELYKVFG